MNRRGFLAGVFSMGVGSTIWPALVAAVSVIAACCWLRHEAVALCGGMFVYPLDDTYIHMALSKTLAETGTWGVEPGRLAFCSSSPLWSLLLALCYCLFGFGESVPWWLALAFSVGSAVLVDRMVAAQRKPAWMRLACAAFVGIAAQLASMTALGMEHAMHAFFLLATLVAVARMTRNGGCRAVAVAGLCAACATASRYESLFLLLPLGLCLAVMEGGERWRTERKWMPWRALAFLVAAVLPVLVYGVWAVAIGGHLLPNSLLLKGNVKPLAALVRDMLNLLVSVPAGCRGLYLVAVLLLVIAGVCRTTWFWRGAAISATIAFGGHLLFARVGQLYRYDSYLMAVNAFVAVGCVVSASWHGDRWRRVLVGMILCAMGIVHGGRFWVNWRSTVWASSDIRSQQVVMTKIISEMPVSQRGCVALNDLGYLALHGGVPFVDLWGLGSQDVTELLLGNPDRNDPKTYEQIFREHEVKYAVLFPNWYPAALMPQGTRDVAYLRLEDNLICGGDTVAFRATSDESARLLRDHLRKYVGQMPFRAKLIVLEPTSSSVETR